MELEEREKYWPIFFIYIQNTKFSFNELKKKEKEESKLLSTFQNKEKHQRIFGFFGKKQKHIIIVVCQENLENIGKK